MYFEHIFLPSTLPRQSHPNHPTSCSVSRFFLKNQMEMKIKTTNLLPCLLPEKRPKLKLMKKHGVLFVFANDSRVCGLTWSVVDMCTDTHLGKMDFPLPRKCQLLTDSWPGMGFSVHFPFSISGILSGLWCVGIVSMTLHAYLPCCVR